MSIEDYWHCGAIIVILMAYGYLYGPSLTPIHHDSFHTHLILFHAGLN